MDDPWVKAVEKLYDLTEAGKLRWDKVDTFTATPMPVGKVYSATVSGRRIVVYETRRTLRLPPPRPLGSFSDFFPKPPAQTTEAVIVIQFVDDQWQPQWQWPGTSEAWKLWDSIKFQVAAGPGFLEALLAT